VGETLGADDGRIVGTGVGDPARYVGDDVGATDGLIVGDDVGYTDGLTVGVNVEGIKVGF
jgi:hypothetical protein